MKKSLLLVVLLAIVAAPAAFATSVSYNTVGEFTNDGGTSFGTSISSLDGNGTLWFTPWQATVPAPPDNDILLGYFHFDRYWFTDAAFGNKYNFVLHVFQTKPADGNSSFVGDISGLISWDDKDTLSWKPTVNEFSITGGGVIDTYRLNLNRGKIDIKDISGFDDGDTKVTASLTQRTSPVPEPGTLAMMGSGLLGLGGMIRRRFGR